PNPHRLGIFISGFREATRGCGPFCVCRRSPTSAPERARFDSLLLSLLSKPAPTSSPEHTHLVFPRRDLHVCHCHRLSAAHGSPARQASAAVGFAAHGIEYRPWRFCVTTRAR